MADGAPRCIVEECGRLFLLWLRVLFELPTEVSDVSAQRFASPAHQYFIGDSSALS
jgi:hypothetical protein